jgi:hypothetical protein
MTPEWTPRVIGISHAVWLDRDRDSRITSPREHAERLLDERDTGSLARKLHAFDRSVTMHVLDLLRSRGTLDSAVKSNFDAEGYALYVQEAGQLRP